MMTEVHRWRYYGGIGARDTPLDVLTTMTALARWQRARGRILRSGAALGADSAFERGAGYLSEIWVPWRKFPYADAGDADPFYFTLPAGPWRTQLEQRAERLHPAWNQLSNAARSLMIRNMAQLYGDSADEPVSEYLVGYAKCDRRGEWLGGTAQAFRAAREIGVPVVNIWMPAGHLAFTSIVEQILTIEDRASRNASVVPAGAATSTEAWSTEA